MKTFTAYLDDFNHIAIIVPKSYHTKHLDFFELRGDDETIELDIQKRHDLNTECKYIVTFDAFIFLNKRYYVVDQYDNKTELFTGKIVRTTQFDTLYYYEGDDLGHTYKLNQTQFKIWSPVAKSMTVLLWKGNAIIRHEMAYKNQGVWELKVNENLDGVKYQYEAFVNGKTQTFIDPYGIASSANGAHSIVVDPNKFYDMTSERPSFSGSATDAIIYEVSIRDLTFDESIKAASRSTFQGATEKGLKTQTGHPAGLDYLASLGVTHIQLMPVYDFEGVDELTPFSRYNWGYNPSQYNVPEGSYTLHPEDPYERINALRKLIDTYHHHKLRVVMDVVYNHVYNPKTFPFDKLIPGYAFRVDEQGMLTESSGCGNDLATQRKMIRKLIVDSVLFWAKVYKIDGFRFDLMGLIDIETMHKLRQKLENYQKDILVYGEGWRMTDHQNFAHMRNKQVLFNIGFFNDTFRDTIKGSTFKLAEPGYIQGDIANLELIKKLIQGSVERQFLFSYPSQSINYVECHDNHTLYDKIKRTNPKENETIRRKRQQLATSMVLLSQGVPFIHMGQEFFRTKKGIENSYDCGDDINMIEWEKVDQFQNAINAFKTLVKIRKEHAIFRCQSRNKIKQHTSVSWSKKGTIRYELKDKDTHFTVFFKPTQEKETLTLPHAVDIVYHSAKVTLHDKEITLEDISTIILKGR